MVSLLMSDDEPFLTTIAVSAFKKALGNCKLIIFLNSNLLLMTQ